MPAFLNLVDFAHRLVGPKPLEFLSGGMNRATDHVIPEWNKYMPRVGTPLNNLVPRGSVERGWVDCLSPGQLLDLVLNNGISAETTLIVTTWAKLRVSCARHASVPKSYRSNFIGLVVIELYHENVRMIH